MYENLCEEARNRIQNLADNLERGMWTLSAALGVAPKPTLLSKLTAVATAFRASSLGLGKEGFVESIYTLERIPPYDPNNAATFETYGEYIARIQPIIVTLGDDPVELLDVCNRNYVRLRFFCSLT